MDPTAFRDNGPADTSVGPYQNVVIFLEPYGVGDGAYTPANIAYCRRVMADWTTATRVACEHLQSDQARALAGDPGLAGDEAILATLACFNSGHPEARGNWWWGSEQASSYRSALTWARGVIGSV